MVCWVKLVHLKHLLFLFFSKSTNDVVMLCLITFFTHYVAKSLSRKPFHLQSLPHFRVCFFIFTNLKLPHFHVLLPQPTSFFTPRVVALYKQILSHRPAISSLTYCCFQCSWEPKSLIIIRLYSFTDQFIGTGLWLHYARFCLL